ncbi:MAG: glycosyltransferase family 87 protein, partial [Planctomycetota bacterium]
MGIADSLFARGPRAGAVGRDVRKTVYRAMAVTVVAIALTKTALVQRSIGRGRHRDYFRWHRAGRMALAGEPLAHMPRDGKLIPTDEAAEPLKFYKLPPAFAVYVAPLALLPYRAYAAVWSLSSAAAAVLAVLLMTRMLHGRCLPANPMALALPAMGALPFVLDDMHCGTCNLHLLALVVLGAYWGWRGRSAAGGMAIGMAAACKAFPVAMLVALVVMRKWRLAAWGMIGTVVFTLAIPGALRGYGRQWDETVAWYRRIVN